MGAKLHAVGAIHELPLPENVSFWLLFAFSIAIACSTMMSIRKLLSAIKAVKLFCCGYCNIRE
jgi:hypothetical protein